MYMLCFCTGAFVKYHSCRVEREGQGREEERGGEERWRERVGEGERDRERERETERKIISVWLCTPECCSKSVCIFTYHMSVQHSILISSHLSLYYHTTQSNAYCALFYGRVTITHIHGSRSVVSLDLLLLLALAEPIQSFYDKLI